jgi:hypothetical protein
MRRPTAVGPRVLRHLGLGRGGSVRHRTGIAWRDLPKVHGPRQTVCTWHCRMASDGPAAAWQRKGTATAGTDDWSFSVDSRSCVRISTRRMSPVLQGLNPLPWSRRTGAARALVFSGRGEVGRECPGDPLEMSRPGGVQIRWRSFTVRRRLRHHRDPGVRRTRAAPGRSAQLLRRGQRHSSRSTEPVAASMVPSPRPTL